MKFLNLPESCPFKRVDRLPEVRHPRYVPPLEDFLKVLQAAEGQDRIMLLAYFFTAARRSELLRLKWEDVDFEAGTVGLWTKKRQRGNWEYDKVPMAQDLALELKKHKLAQGGGEFVFTRKSGKRFTKRNHLMAWLCRLAGVKPFGFHGIRHLAPSVAIDNAAVSLFDVQHLLRHASAMTTQRYLHKLRKNNRAVDALEGALKRQIG